MANFSILPYIHYVQVYSITLSAKNFFCLEKKEQNSGKGIASIFHCYYLQFFSLSALKNPFSQNYNSVIV